MPLKINENIDTTEGLTVPSGSIVTFDTIFPSGKNEAHFNMKFFTSQSALDDGKSNYFPELIPNMGYVKYYESNEFTGLTVTQVYTDLRDHLETIFTGGTVNPVNSLDS
jgi:hypothetical protein